MKNEKKTKIIHQTKTDHLHDIFYKTNPASVNDFTGLAPIVPDSDFMAENYENMMDVPVTAKHKDKDSNDYGND